MVCPGSGAWACLRMQQVWLWCERDPGSVPRCGKSGSTGVRDCGGACSRCKQPQHAACPVLCMLALVAACSQAGLGTRGHVPSERVQHICHTVPASFAGVLLGTVRPGPARAHEEVPCSEAFWQRCWASATERTLKLGATLACVYITIAV